jgi:hypothetical protein
MLTPERHGRAPYPIYPTYHIQRYVPWPHSVPTSPTCFKERFSARSEARDSMKPPQILSPTGSATVIIGVIPSPITESAEPTSRTSCSIRGLLVHLPQR